MTTLYRNPDRADHTSWIVYMNGVEVPCESATITSGVWAFSECVLNMVPDKDLVRLGSGDRVPVQVFYADQWQGTPEFRMLFDGEITGFGYVNARGQRRLSFRCADYMQILTQLFFFFMSSVDNIATGVADQAIGATPTQINLPGFAPIYPYSLFAEGLVPAGDTSAPYIKRPIDFIYNVVKGLTSVALSNRSIPGVNFFSPWVRRTGFHRRFIALPLLEDPANTEDGIFPILRAVQADWAMAAVARLATSINNSGSIWDMITQIFQTLMVEMTSLPTPAAVSSDYETLLPRPLADSEHKFLTNYFVKPQFLFGLPPACNVIFPSQHATFMYDEEYLTQPTRVYYNDEALSQFLNTENSMGSGLSTMLRDAMSVGYPPAVNDAMRAALENTQINGKNILTEEEYFKGPVVLRRQLPRWFTFLQQANMPPTTATSTDNTVFQLYAKYEYFKERYARRSGSVNLAFNPYIVAGFPCAVFEDLDTEVHIFGYVTRVQHSLTNSGCTTSMSYSYGRTMREMFTLLREQFDLENEALREQEAAQQEADEEGEAAADITTPVAGAVAMAPPEPIREVRDVIQNFDRADAFYKALFWKGASTTNNSISIAQLEAEAERRNLLGPQANPANTLEINATHVFRYDKIIELVDEEGDATTIVIDGLDASAKTYVLGLLDRMENTGDLTEEELKAVQIAVGRNELRQQNPDNRDPNLTQEIQSIVSAVTAAQVNSNVTGEKSIRPRQEAMYLFESRRAAMAYGARPICTLDEYIDFHEKGVRVGAVDPTAALASGSARAFKAKYYQQILNLKPGPPVEYPGAGASEGTIAARDEEFPDSRANWTALLLKYTQRVLRRISPRK